LLAALSTQPRTWHYGYELSKQTGLASGTLYPLLIRLSDQGLLTSQWQEPERPGRPPRHAYRLTPNGLAFARTVAEPRAASVLRRKLLGATT
jgi:DNA-binding PadR family transcriptional regulator